MPTLTRSKYGLLRSLFPKEPHIDLIINAVIAGNTPAEVVVNDPRRPAAVFIWLHTDVVLFGGHPDETFTAEAAAFIQQRRREGRRAFMGIPTTTNWDNMQLIFRGFDTVRDERMFLKLITPRLTDWRERIPDDVIIETIDAELLCQVCYENNHYLADDIDRTWPTTDHFHDNGFGHAALFNYNIIAGWCTAEYISKGRCAISIETVEEFQNQGIGTLTAAAFVETAAARQLDVYWDCWADFHVCRRLAEKVGFRSLYRYPVAVARA